MYGHLCQCNSTINNSTVAPRCQGVATLFFWHPLPSCGSFLTRPTNFPPESLYFITVLHQSAARFTPGPCTTQTQ